MPSLVADSLILDDNHEEFHGFETVSLGTADRPARPRRRPDDPAASAAAAADAGGVGMNAIRKWIDSVTDSGAALPLRPAVLPQPRRRVRPGPLRRGRPRDRRSTFGISEQAVITIATISGALVIMASVFIGVLADRYEPRPADPRRRRRLGQSCRC